MFQRKQLPVWPGDFFCSYCGRNCRNTKSWYNPFTRPTIYQCSRWWCRFRTGHLRRIKS